MSSLAARPTQRAKALEPQSAVAQNNTNLTMIAARRLAQGKNSRLPYHVFLNKLMEWGNRRATEKGPVFRPGPSWSMTKSTTRKSAGRELFRAHNPIGARIAHEIFRCRFSSQNMQLALAHDDVFVLLQY